MNRLILLMSSLLLLSACGEDRHEDVRQWMDEQSKGMQTRIKSPPPLVVPQIVSFTARNVASPFDAEKIRAKEGGLMDPNSPAYGRAPEYLESFPLESMRVIGVISYNGQMFALVQTPEKPKHVTIGNYMGPNYGQITEISRTQVKITERVKDSNDTWTKREKVLYLQQAEGDKK